MRLTGGALGGRAISAPPGRATRPTSDMVREALFQVLGDLDGMSVLDLFAGSGALGLEALSRGAAQATFVDRSAGAERAVRANLRRLGLEADVVRDDARRWLRRARAQGRRYDLVLLDPPYRLAAGLGRDLSEAIPRVLADGGRVVCESDRRAPLELDLPVRDERRYGDTLVRIHRVSE